MSLIVVWACLLANSSTEEANDAVAIAVKEGNMPFTGNRTGYTSLIKILNVESIIPRDEHVQLEFDTVVYIKKQSRASVWEYVFADEGKKESSGIEIAF